MGGLLAACGGGDDSDDTADTTSTTSSSTTIEVEETSSTTTEDGDGGNDPIPLDLGDPDDDTNGDGVRDPFCGEADYGGGLVLQVHCDREGLTAEIPEGVTLVEESLLSQRSSIHRDLSGISGNLIVTRDPDDRRVAILVFHADVLFGSGTAELEEDAAANFDGVIRFVADNWPGSAVQVRGHTDADGDPAANQTLSESRAASVRQYLVDNAIDASDVSTIGFGETQPLALEDTEEGKSTNRRVEVVIRPPTG